jgi:hypothetical protein
MNRFSTHNVVGFIVGLGEVVALCLVLALIFVVAGVMSGSL